jgi:transcriptional regulator with XRE-family HTH domain
MQADIAIMVWVMKMLAKNLRTARNAKGYTQDDVAEHLGVKRQTYSAYERSKSIPDAITLNKLAKFYDVSVDNLFGDDEPGEAHEKAASNDGLRGLVGDDVQLAPIIELLRNLTPDAVDQIAPIIQDMHELPKHRKTPSIETETAERLKRRFKTLLVTL